MSRNYKFYNPDAAYFVSFATVCWVDVFTRSEYFNVLARSLVYCREHKGMSLFAYCFMPNHVHMIFRSQLQDPSGLLRDFKSYTGKKLLQAISNHPRESRKEWLLKLFIVSDNYDSGTINYQFWNHHNKPIELWTPSVIKQKLDYIHNNPVVAGFVTEPTHWKWSSARNFAGDHSVIQIDEIGFLS